MNSANNVGGHRQGWWTQNLSLFDGTSIDEASPGTAREGQATSALLQAALGEWAVVDGYNSKIASFLLKARVVIHPNFQLWLFASVQWKVFMGPHGVMSSRTAKTPPQFCRDLLPGPHFLNLLSPRDFVNFFSRTMDEFPLSETQS